MKPGGRAEPAGAGVSWFTVALLIYIMVPSATQRVNNFLGAIFGGIASFLVGLVSLAYNTVREQNEGALAVLVILLATAVSVVLARVLDRKRARNKKDEGEHS